MTDSHIKYCCETAWNSQSEWGNPKFFTSIEKCHEKMPCTNPSNGDHCGIAEVEIKLVNIVQKENSEYGK